MILRLGDDLGLRIPRRLSAAELIDHEQRWLPELAPLLPIPIPAPVRIGKPTVYFPYSWSVVPWVEGTVALYSETDPVEAGRLGEFLAALHHIRLPENPPTNPYRGRPLVERGELSLLRLEGAATELGPAQAAATRQLLERAFDLPVLGPSSWIHGDLHSKNVIVTEGRIASIIDWGDVCAGDRATDLAGLWILFPTAAHDSFWSSYGEVDDAVFTRARAWAVAFGLMLYESHHEVDPAFSRAGLATIRRAVAT